MDRPILAVTLGDPAGIGPEITLRALSHADIFKRCRPLVVGDAWVLENAMNFPGMPALMIHAVHSVKEALFIPGTVDVLDEGAMTPPLTLGAVSPAAGEAAFRYVVKAIELAMAGQVDATVTNPLNKEALNAAGHHYAGHTELYAEYTHTPNYTMMLAYGNLRIVHVSTHVSLRDACDRAKQARVLEVIRIAHNACLRMGIAQPKIGVAGLNPHAGEHGLFGREEIEEIEPAVKQANAEGIHALGPEPPDTIFSKARGGWYDAVVAMYHDQGHIPLKMLGFTYDNAAKRWNAVGGVNITLGLPIIRTSVDHGTAFDQAGLGTASEESLINAMDYAIEFAGNRTAAQQALFGSAPVSLTAPQEPAKDDPISI
ncbi:MAG: 4-hydroxythreonine-4-phosphate dehydrogenase PdxA, partial [Eubacteriales bacterium]|nr:4-hydroxythreonine-4-phosphate dehydrogenase PdxA [Eubacteriales bacterium]